MESKSMIYITQKSMTKRSSIAIATLKVGMNETMAAIRNKTVPKGDVLEVSRTAGLFAVKRTADMIPDCHPLPIEYTKISFELLERGRSTKRSRSDRLSFWGSLEVSQTTA
jgi:cyclic pyranopterin monophosphate synthase